jgi:hypothetical protein
MESAAVARNDRILGRVEAGLERVCTSIGALVSVLEELRGDMRRRDAQRRPRARDAPRRKQKGKLRKRARHEDAPGSDGGERDAEDDDADQDAGGSSE